MPYDDALADRIRSQAPRGAVEKAMFGGLAFMVDGNMSVGVIDDRMVVRVGPDAYADALALEHVSEMDFTGRSMKGWVYVAPDAISTDTALRDWVERGVAFARSLPKK